jgi:dTDP-4-amino-4,6-dideoxygalactose transaminase
MKLPISRGRISHSLTAEIGWLLRSLGTPLSNSNKVNEAEAAFASYIGRSHCVVFPFARTAIWSTLKALNLPKGSRVLLPPLTIKPILDVVIHLGYEPIFVDIDPVTASFDERELIAAMATKPSVAILTYLFGLVPRVESLQKTLKDENVFIIEDFSQCLNGEYNGRKIGTFGDVSIYSASSVKTFDTFGGGYALTDDAELANALRRFQQSLEAPSRRQIMQGITRNLIRNVASSRLVFPFFTYWFLRLAARKSKQAVGRFTGARSTEPLSELPRDWFRKYSSLQAQVALRELPRVRRRDKDRIDRIRQLTSLCDPLDRPRGADHQSHVYWQFLVYVDNFERAREHFAQFGVDCATTSLVLLTDLPKYPGQRKTPAAQRLYELGVYLPCYHQLHEVEVHRISEALRGISASS